MDEIILGDNQFFGINHMSEEKARAQQIRFQDTQAIIDVIDGAYKEGVRALMCTTHERIGEICDYFRNNKSDYPGFKFYPCMPYAHKYANAVTEDGMLGALRKFMPDDNPVAAILKGGVAIATKDIEVLIKILVDAEMKVFNGVETPVIFLQNVVTDLLLGLKMHEPLRMFYEHVRNRYGAEAGFISMNAPILLEALNEVGISNPIVCCNFNKIEFRMCGGRALYEKTFAAGSVRGVAMSVFASGAIPPQEAVQYVCRQPGIQSIVFGASSRANIRSTVGLINEYWPQERLRMMGGRAG